MHDWHITTTGDHLGAAKMKAEAYKFYTGRKINLEDYCLQAHEHCHGCLSKKQIPKTVKLHTKHQQYNAPYDLFVGDCTKLPAHLRFKGAEHLFNVVDHFSRFAFSWAIPDKKGATILKCLLELVVNPSQKPRALQFDNGSEFQNRDIANFCSEYSIKLKFGDTYTPQH